MAPETDKPDLFVFFLSKINIKVVFFIMIFFGPFFYVSADRLPYFPSSYVIIGQFVRFFLIFFIIISFAIMTFVKRDFRIHINKPVVAISFYIAACLLSVFFNFDEWKLNGLKQFVFISCNFIVFLIMLYTLKDTDHKLLIYAMTCLIFFNCILSYVDFVIKFSNNYIGKDSGFFGDRIYYGRLGVIISTYLIIMLFNAKTTVEKLLLITGILFLFVNISLLLQRGIYMAYFFTITAIILGTKNKKIIIIGALLVCVIGVLFGYMVVKRVKSQKMNVVNMSDAGRVSSIYAGINMWKTYPIFGVGFGTAAFRMRKYENIHIMGINNQVFGIHNSYVMRLAETGIAGFISFGIFNIMLLSKLVRRFKGKKNIVKECPYEFFYTLSFCVYFITGMLYPINDREGYYWYLSAGAIILLRDVGNLDT